MRICSLLPGATEILYALGLGEALVGVSHECDYPPQALRLPRVVRTTIDANRLSSEAIDRSVRQALEAGQPLYDIDADVLERLRPDLIVTQELCEVCAVSPSTLTEALRRLPSPPQVVSLHPHTLSDMLEDIQRLGEATGRREQAHALAERLRERVARIRERVAAVGHWPRVFCLEWLKPPMTSGHWVPEQVELAGGLEVLGRAGERSRQVSWDEIAAAAPEAIVLMPCGFPVERTRREVGLVTGEPLWARLPAVRADRVWFVDGSSYFNRPGPRLIDGIELLAGLLHPGRFDAAMPCGAAEVLARR